MDSIMTDEQAFLAAIIANPDDDLPRLVYADWLRESWQPEDSWARGEFIQVQCEIANPDRPRCTCYMHGCEELYGVDINTGCDAHRNWINLYLREQELLSRLPKPHYALGVNLWTATGLKRSSGTVHTPYLVYDRGFIVEVGIPTLDTWLGGECGNCDGNGGVSVWAGDSDSTTDYIWADCQVCCHTGHTPGIGPAIASKNPVELVRVGDLEPQGPTPSYLDWNWNRLSGRGAHMYGNHWLPDDLWILLDDYIPQPESRRNARVYRTREAAIKALSDALISLARKATPCPAN
jgi:uncharacterized protein (TIGR02996 family)